MRLHPIENPNYPSEDANFKCDKCDLAFQTKEELDDHEGLHQLSQDNAETLALMSDRKWKCEFCTRSFKGEFLLKRSKCWQFSFCEKLEKFKIP